MSPVVISAKTLARVVIFKEPLLGRLYTLLKVDRGPDVLKVELGRPGGMT